MARHDLTVILPTYQEQETIAALISRIETAIRPQMIIVVDDSPDDATVLAIASLPKTIPIKTMHNNPPLGLAASLNQGICAVTTTAVAWMDADLSHPPELLPNMFSMLQTHDIVSASWLTPNGRDERPMLVRSYSVLINRLCQLFFGPDPITAYTSGYLMIKTAIGKNIMLRGAYGEYCIDFLVQAKRAGYQIQEVSYALKERTSGYSKTRSNPLRFIRHGAGYLGTVLRLALRPGH
jgi:dolichol-phosphate mannosyltransferase